MAIRALHAASRWLLPEELYAQLGCQMQEAMIDAYEIERESGVGRLLRLLAGEAYSLLATARDERR